MIGLPQTILAAEMMPANLHIHGITDAVTSVVVVLLGIGVLLPADTATACLDVRQTLDTNPIEMTVERNTDMEPINEPVPWPRDGKQSAGKPRTQHIGKRVTAHLLEIKCVQFIGYFRSVIQPGRPRRFHCQKNYDST